MKRPTAAQRKILKKMAKAETMHPDCTVHFDKSLIGRSLRPLLRAEYIMHTARFDAYTLTALGRSMVEPKE